MKILPSVFINQSRPVYQITPYKKQENGQDTFVKSTNSLSFTGNEEYQNPYQKVLQNPTLTQKVMELVTTAATILVGKAAGIVPKTPDNCIDVENICKDVVNEQNDDKEQILQYRDEIDSLKGEIAHLQEENENLRKLYESKSDFQADISENISKDNENEKDSVNPVSEATNDNEEQKPLPETDEYTFEFPKKKAGILSKAQKELKEITMGLPLGVVSGQKLEQICKELLQNGSHPVEGEIVDNKDLIVDLNNRLISSDKENLDQIIDEFYKKCELVSKDAEISGNTENPKVEIYETEKVVLTPPKVLGKIELSDKDANKRRFKPASSAQEDTDVQSPKRTGKRPRIVRNAENSRSPERVDSEMELMNDKTKVSIFRIPGTVDKNVMVNLRHLLVKFERQVEKENINPRYQHSRSLGQVFNEDILAELSAPNDSPYKNINKNNAVEIADAINSDPRFCEMFTLHAAMRLIDRFADFNSDVPVESQCHMILDKLTDVLQKSFKEGIEVRRYKDPANRIGLRLSISEDVYDEEAKAIFGSYPFRLGMCENQPNPNFYSKYSKQPLICTIFTKGI